MPSKKPTPTTTKKIEPRAKYDWYKMQVEFFKSDIVEVFAFLREKYWLDANKNGAIARRVKGWSEQKVQLKRESVENAKAKIVDLYTPTAQELAQMHQGVITIFKASLQKELADCLEIDPKTGKQKVVRAPNIAEMERIWRIVKAEKLEPTAVQKNENTISDEGRNALSRLLRENFGDEDEE